jgi:hypothetical protein
MALFPVTTCEALSLETVPVMACVLLTVIAPPL